MIEFLEKFPPIYEEEEVEQNKKQKKTRLKITTLE